MDIPKLITLVQNYPELYNLRHSEYFNTLRRDNIWEEIGTVLNQPGGVCKDRWVKVRDNHRKALQRRKITSGQSASTKKPAKYEQELTFLVPYFFDEENRQSNFASSSCTTFERNIASPAAAKDNEELQEGLREDYELSQQLISPASTSSSSLPPAPAASKPLQLKKKQKFQPEKSAASILQNYLSIREKQVTGTHQTKPEDPLINFFMSMAHTVKTFPLRDQVDIKGQLFEIVHRVERKIAYGEPDPPRGPPETTAMFYPTAQMSVDQETQVEATTSIHELT